MKKAVPKIDRGVTAGDFLILSALVIAFAFTLYMTGRDEMLEEISMHDRRLVLCHTPGALVNNETLCNGYGQ